MRNALIFIAAVVLAVWATFALADPRMDSIQAAYFDCASFALGA